MDTSIAVAPTTNKKGVRTKLHKSMYLYILLAPAVVYFLMFRYAPMFGLVIVFKDYDILQGFVASEWVGFENLRDLFQSPDFTMVFRNTLIISFYKLLAGFPAPIIVALLLNEIRRVAFKRTLQTVLYFPYFISWAVIGGILIVLFSTATGVFGGLSERLTGSRLSLLASRDHFRAILVVSDVWRHVGWGSIVYLAAISQIDPQLYEAATVDGANRWSQAWHITIPSISSVIVLLLILRIGWIMRAGFEQILVLQNGIVRDVSEVFETYVYRVGIGRGNYSFAAAADFFKSVISLLMVLAADRFAKAIGEEGLL